MKLEFKSQDFPWKEIDLTCGINSPAKHKAVAKKVAKLVNARLAEMLEEAPMVYMVKGFGHYDKWIEDESELDGDPTHTARLVCIEAAE